jgi:hypothetical protein
MPGAPTSSASKSWLFRGLTGVPFLSAFNTTSLSLRLNEKLISFHGLKVTALRYPAAGAPQLRCDSMNQLFHLDKISDAMDVLGRKGLQISLWMP